MKRLLIISPHFPPINAPDHQRVRMSLPYFEQFGWKAHVLTVQPTDVQGVWDDRLVQTVPSQIPVTHIPTLPIQQTRRIGLGSLGLRCFPGLLKVGDRLLRQQEFDLIYFSTTVFITMVLGARWQHQFGIPYVLDFQDPWLNDYYRRSGITPPGGYLKHEFAQLQAKLLEPKAVNRASHIISVSPAYPQILQQRYPRLRPDQFSVLPFGAPETDFEILPSLQIKQTLFDPDDGRQHWVYVGRGGEDMALALRSLFLAIQQDRQQDPDRWQNTRLHFIGTSYAPKERATKSIEPIAQELEVADLVIEHPCRIPYFEALQVLVDSDAILLIGSDDASYTASKIYPCVLARKPTLAIFHQQSSVVNILEQCQTGKVVSFTTADRPEALQPKVSPCLTWLLAQPKGYQPETNWVAFKAYTAKEMTRQQCQIFDRCLARRTRIASS